MKLPQGHFSLADRKYDAGSLLKLLRHLKIKELSEINMDLGIWMIQVLNQYYRTH